MHRQQRLRPSPTSTLSSSTSASSPSPLPSPLSSLTSPSSSSPLPSSTSSPMSWSPSSSATLWSPSWSASSSSFTAYPWSAHRSWCSRLSSFPMESTTGSRVSALVSGSKSSIPCPRLLSVVAWSMTLLLISSCMGLADAGILNGHPLGKRSFIDIQCKGIYDKSIFARLDRICEDCYNLFREPQLHQLCRKNCFTSDYFKGCLDVLLLQDEVEKIQTWIKQLHGAEPGV